jgi:hypothetical protein
VISACRGLRPSCDGRVRIHIKSLENGAPFRVKDIQTSSLGPLYPRDTDDWDSWPNQKRRSAMSSTFRCDLADLRAEGGLIRGLPPGPGGELVISACRGLRPGCDERVRTPIKSRVNGAPFRAKDIQTSSLGPLYPRDTNDRVSWPNQQCRSAMPSTFRCDLDDLGA